MDIRSRYYGFRAAFVLLTILFIIPFFSKGDSDPLVSLTEKKCSHPNTHRRLSDPNFSNFLDSEIHSRDLCEGMINNTDIFGLSSLIRQLMGEGSHRQLVTTMVFCNHSKFAEFVKEHFCEAFFIEYLPAGIFSDPFELQHLVRREVFLGASVFGDTNLELPSALSNRSTVEIRIDVKSDTQIVVQLPLHSRYPPLDSSGYANVTIGKPDIFLRCKTKDTQTEACCLSTLINLGNFSGSNLIWRIPCGNESHTRLVTILTFLSALFCSLLIVLSSIYHSSKNKSKLE